MKNIFSKAKKYENGIVFLKSLKCPAYQIKARVSCLLLHVIGCNITPSIASALYTCEKLK